MPPTNRLELRVMGQQRSGNHAIITWILDQHRGEPRCFLNNVRHGEGDPYATYGEFVAHDVPTAAPHGSPAEIEEVRAAKKRLLVWSLEDDLTKMPEGATFLDEDWFRSCLVDQSARVGPSERRLDLLVIRDPFNFFASRLKMLGALTGCKDVPTIAAAWKLAAKSAIEVQRSGDPDRIVLNYNSWFGDEVYRRQLSARLDGRFEDETMGQVAWFGGGSSFDGQTHSRLKPRAVVRNWRKLLRTDTWRQARTYARRLFAPNATEMRVLERWRTMADDVTFRRVFTDLELLELSEVLFGELPDTRAYVKGR